MLNSCCFPVFLILIKEEKMRVLKQRAIFYLMHPIKQFENIRAFFLLRSELQKPDINTNLTKTLPKTRKILSYLTLPFLNLDH